MIYRLTGISITICLMTLPPAFSHTASSYGNPRQSDAETAVDTAISPDDSTGVSGDTLVLTMTSARELFLKANLAILAGRFHVTTSEADLVAAKLFPNPQFSANISYVNLSVRPVDYSSAQTSYRIDQLIELWGKRGKRIDMAAHSVESAHADFQSMLFSLMADLKESYLDAVFAQREYDLAKKSYDQFGQSVEMSRLRFKTGDISEADLKKLELESLDYHQTLSQAQQDLADAFSRLREFLNLKPSVSLRMEHNLRHGQTTLFETDSLEAIALHNRADVISQREKTLTQQSRIDLAHANGLPDVTLGVELDRQGPNFRNTFGGGIGITLPIFNRNQDEVQRAEAEYQAALYDQQALENSVLNSVKAAHQKYRDSWDMMKELSPATLEDAEEVRSLAMKSYSSGNISLLEFLETEKIYNDAVQSYYTALKRFLDNQIELERALGKELF